MTTTEIPLQMRSGTIERALKHNAGTEQRSFFGAPVPAKAQDV
jgi:hypothetical protein